MEKDKNPAKRMSVTVLEECIEVQKRKSEDYQNPNSNVVQAMHYRRGIDTLHDALQGKLFRAQSLLESGKFSQANYESLEDSYMDLINYASFCVAWLRYGIPGQRTDRDMFNKPLPTKVAYKSDENLTLDEIFAESEELDYRS